MDQHKLRSHVFDKTGIKIDVDDPIFALVALNEAVLAETVERQLALLDAATQALAAQARAAGGLPAAVPQPAPQAPAVRRLGFLRANGACWARPPSSPSPARCWCWAARPCCINCSTDRSTVALRQPRASRSVFPTHPWKHA